MEEYPAPGFDNRRPAPTPQRAPQEQAPVSPVAPRTVKDSRLDDLYGDRASDVRRQKTASRYIVLSPEQLDDDNAIDIVERTPAYNRDRKLMNAVKSNTHAAPKPARDPNVIDFSDDF